MSNFPEELIRIAATGSSPRTRATVDQTRFPLLEHWKNNGTMPERDLLLSMASYGLQQQAGYSPDKTLDALPQQAPPSTSRACTLTAQQHLKLMLNHVHEELLPYWIDALHDYGQRIPAEMLPSVLDYGNRQPQHHALLRLAIDERGRWLANHARKDNWEWILQDDDYEPPHESVYPAWENHFRRMRKKDPVHMLRVVEKHWDDLDIFMRMAILRSMHIGLNSKDTDFLMRVFENPTTAIIAARWLVQIEDSEFSKVARHNIEQMLALAPIGQDGEWVVDFTWADTFKGHPARISYDRAAELSNIMGFRFEPEAILMMLPLSYWYKTYDVSPTTLVIAARNSTRPSIFYRIWSDMATQEPDSDFLFALVMNVERHADVTLVNYLTQEQLIHAAAHWLRLNPVFSLQHNAIGLLGAIQQTWNDELAEIFLVSLDACFKQVARPLLEADIRQTLKQYARLIPLKYDRRFEDVLHIAKRDELSDTEIEQLNGIINIIRFRAEMMQAIRDGAPQSYLQEKPVHD